MRNDVSKDFEPQIAILKMNRVDTQDVAPFVENNELRKLVAPSTDNIELKTLVEYDSRETVRAMAELLGA